MTHYIFPLLAVMVLCGFWAIFQIWLSRHDPDVNARSTKCDGCRNKGECQ